MVHAALLLCSLSWFPAPFPSSTPRALSPLSMAGGRMALLPQVDDDDDGLVDEHAPLDPPQGFLELFSPSTRRKLALGILLPTLVITGLNRANVEAELVEREREVAQLQRAIAEDIRRRQSLQGAVDEQLFAVEPPPPRDGRSRGEAVNTADGYRKIIQSYKQPWYELVFGR
ncbi:hypothetical protein AB1Y20_008196 [Prymnesium parvum]|uniref:Uncharacterized protein n=1 Tax=Prymnesium parvum TaxID=97485 RepID=A0AB34IXA3_PRYPA